MKKYFGVAGTAAVLALTFFVVAAPAQHRAAKQNKSFQPEAAARAASFVTTGAVARIKSAGIAKDGTITARFTITDSKGAGLDVNGILTPGTMSVRFVAAYIPAGKTQYVAYTVSTLTLTSNNNPSQIVAGTDAGGKFTLVDAATGTYDYTFGTKAPVTFDAAATHSIGMQLERTLSEFGMDTAASDNVFTFVPNGSAVTNVRDVINEASCNKCHDPISAHGGGRKTMLYCVLCHTPQSTNPDTQNTVDMPVFIHKLHMGANLPSVKAGNPYFVVHRGAVNDYSDIAFPQGMNNCTTCHESGTAQSDIWKTKPSRAVCGSCHDNVNFATGENHVNLPQQDDNNCKACHGATAGQDFDASIPGAHVSANDAKALPGLVTKVLNIENAAPGKAPTVTFEVKNKAGNPVDISKLTTMRVVLTGPNTDYQVGAGGIRASENPATTPGVNGIYTYTMTNKIPAAAAGSYTISLEARNSVTLLAGTTRERTAVDWAIPIQSYFSVDNSPVVARRQVVSSEKCNSCHKDLAFIHGGSRAETQECVVCHNPMLVDGTSNQSVNFATQIHSTHRGKELANPYILGTTNYQEVGFPGDLRNCNKCHVNDSHRVENVGARAMVQTPGHFTPTTAPISAACLGCHDTLPAASHALAATTVIGESCTACHGQNSEFAVDKVHGR